jgi:hypothetical protein
MTYDSDRKRTILFGGSPGNGLFGDTWEWNGDLWTQVEDIGPSPRALPAMTYDKLRQRVVVFGGNVSTDGAAPAGNGDTWEWDGQAWAQVADSGPGARFGTALAYDSVRQLVVLFGGANATASFSDTWEWDGTNWTQVADTGPSQRNGHSMCYDDVRGRVVLFGGGLKGENDTWEYDGTAWTRQADTGPQGRSGHSLAFSGTRTILFGGILVDATGKEIATAQDTWEWSGKFWTQRQDMGPAPREGHSMSYDSDRDRVVLFGGLNANVLSDTWELPGSAITLVSLVFVGNGGAQVFTGTVTLSAPAPIGGIAVSLSIDQPTFMQVPSSLVVPEGALSAPCNMTRLPANPGPGTIVAVTAKLGSSTLVQQIPT